MKTSRLALLAPLLLAAACSTWNPLKAVGIMGESINPPTPLTPITGASANPRAVWSSPVGKNLGYVFRPEIDGGRVYAAAGDGTLTVLDEDSGRQISKYDTKKKLAGGLEVADGKIIVASVKGDVMALDTGGKPLWTVSISGEVIAPAALSHKIVVVRTTDGRIFGYSAEDGKRLWVFQRPNPALLLRTEAGVLAIGADVVAGYPNGKLIALDIEDGKLTWEVTVMQPRGATELERIADVAGLPIVDGPHVCAGAFQGKVSCFEIQTRELVWSRDLSSARSLASDAKNLYIVDDVGAVHALDKKTGASVWKQDKLLYRRLSAPVVLDGRIVVGDGSGFLHVLSPDDGALIGRLATDGTEVISIVPSKTGLIVQTAGGQVASVRF
jgi:outer membrane protein assembly factor BamB